MIELMILAKKNMMKAKDIVTKDGNINRLKRNVRLKKEKDLQKCILFIHVFLLFQSFKNHLQLFFLPLCTFFLYTFIKILILHINISTFSILFYVYRLLQRWYFPS